MKGLIPYGGIEIAAGAATQALSTSMAQVTQFSAAGGANLVNTFDDAGNPDVKGDKANNRVLVAAPGVYEVDVQVSGITDGTQDISLQLAKNGVVIANTLTKRSWTVSIKNDHHLKAIVTISASDNPGTIATNAEPSGTFTGGGGYPKREVPLTLFMGSGASTPTITFENVRFIVKRIG